MSVAFLFPGQGEQHPGILHHQLPAGSDDLLEAASDVLGLDVTTLDAADALTRTWATQLALLITGTAWARAAMNAGLQPDFVAGHSVGSWTAAVAADAIDFADAVRLVDVRARSMALSAPAESGMIAIDGLPVQVVENAAAALRRDGRQVWASNVNSPLQCTASGVRADLDALEDELRASGARRVTPLAVSVPAHTPLMQEAEEAVGRALDGVEIRRPRIPIAGNVTGQTLFTAERLRTDLSASITRGVRWDTATAILAERGVDIWVQVPPGHSLLALVPREVSMEMAMAMEDQSISVIARLVAKRHEMDARTGAGS